MQRGSNDKTAKTEKPRAGDASGKAAHRDDRRQRLATALRENLRRRKTQARARAGTPDEEPS